MSRLFRRIGRVSVSKPRGFFDQGGNAITVEDLRFTFDIEKDLTKHPNTSTVTIFNLAEETRAEFQARPLRVLLEAGYDGDPKRLFVGDLRRCTSKRERTGWSTELLLGDGERARKARVKRSYKAGVSARDAVREVAKAMGLKVPAKILDSDEFRVEFVSGLVLDGSAADKLTELLDRSRMTWSLQDGRLQILRERDVRDDAPLVVSQDNGMIGSPEFGSPERGKKSPILNVQSQLYPEITPGGRIDVRSRSVRGVFRVERVRHTGDTHGDSWTTQIEARAV